MNACRLCLLMAYSCFAPSFSKDTFYTFHGMVFKDKRVLETCQVVKEENDIYDNKNNSSSLNNNKKEVFYDVLGDKNIELLGQLLGSSDLIPLVLDYLCSYLVRNITPALITTWAYGTIKSESVYQLQVQSYYLSWPQLAQAFKTFLPYLVYYRQDTDSPGLCKRAAQMFHILPSEVRAIHVVSLCASVDQTSGWSFGNGDRFTTYWFFMIQECKKNFSETSWLTYLARFCFVALRNPCVSGEILMKALYSTAIQFECLEESTFAENVQEYSRKPFIPLSMQDPNECIAIWQEKLHLLDSSSDPTTEQERKMLTGFIEFATKEFTLKKKKKWETRIINFKPLVKTASCYSSLHDPLTGTGQNYFVSCPIRV